MATPTPARPTPRERVKAALKTQVAKPRAQAIPLCGFGLTEEAEAAVVAAKERWAAKFQAPQPADPDPTS